MNEKEETQLLVKLVNFVIRNGEDFHARKRFRVAGLPIYYDKVWFPPYGRDSYTVAGKEWSATLHFMKENSNRHADCYLIDGKNRQLDYVKIVNREVMLKDLSLLRLFGIEAIFSQ